MNNKEGGRVEPLIAVEIASIEDEDIRQELLKLAVGKDREGLERAIERCNMRTDYKLALAQSKAFSRERVISEDYLLVKIEKRINEWTMAIGAINELLLEDNKFIRKFSPENRLLILDKLKPLRKETTKFLELMEKSEVKQNE